MRAYIGKALSYQGEIGRVVAYAEKSPMGPTTSVKLRFDEEDREDEWVEVGDLDGFDPDGE